MPLNQEKLAAALSTRYGGSLLLEKQLLQQEEVTVFFGLGGLGGRAVNAIKAATNERLDNRDRRFFMVVDTCKDDMDKVSVAQVADVEAGDIAEGPRGCIEEHEKLPIFGESYRIKELGYDVESWLNKKQLGEVSVSRIVAMSFCEPRSWGNMLSS